MTVTQLFAQGASKGPVFDGLFEGFPAILMGLGVLSCFWMLATTTTSDPDDGVVFVVAGLCGMLTGVLLFAHGCETIPSIDMNLWLLAIGSAGAGGLIAWWVAYRASDLINKRGS